MSRLRWHIDEIGCGRLRGWALDASAPQERPVLDIFLDGHLAAQVLANQNRPDLRGAGIGDGYHGFEWRHPALAGPEARKRVAVEWPRIGFWARKAPVDAGTMGLRYFRSADAYLRARLAELRRDATKPVLSAGAQSGRPAFARLLEPVRGDIGGQGRRISAYQSYILQRFRMEWEFDPAFTLGEYRRFLRWYIQHYGAVRANLRIPLSAADIEFLNAPLPGETGRIGAMTIFAEDFRARPGLEGADWAFFNATSLGLADCLRLPLTDDGASRLALFARQHPIFRTLDLAKGENRDGIAALLAMIHPEQPSSEEAGFRVEAASLPVTNSELVDVQVIGPFSKALGVGESCRRMAKALEDTGFSLRRCDFTIDYPNEGLENLPFLLEEPGPAKVNLIHLNCDEVPKLMAYWPDVFTGATNIAVPYLELSDPAPEHELGLALVDRVFAATTHIREVIGDRLPVDVVGNAVELQDLMDRQSARRAALGGICAPDDFVVLVSGDALSGLDRKNLTGAVRAFLAAFPDEPNRRLIIKTHSVSRMHDARQQRIWDDLQEIAAGDPRIHLLDRHLDTAAYRRLQAASDVYLSLHRAEGLGYHVLECMQLGIPCIVTDYSGTRDFCSGDTALLVGYRLVPVRVWEYPFSRGEQVWAEPHLAEAVRHLRALAADPELGIALGRRASQQIRELYSLPALGERLGRLLEPVVNAAAERSRANP